MNYYISGTYFDQEGIVVNSDFERVQFLANIDAKVSERLSVGLNSVVSRSDQNGVSTQSTGSDAIGSVNGGGDDVVALASTDDVIATHAEDEVVALSSEDDVRSGRAYKYLGCVGAHDGDRLPVTELSLCAKLWR